MDVCHVAEANYFGKTTSGHWVCRGGRELAMKSACADLNYIRAKSLNSLGEGA